MSAGGKAMTTFKLAIFIALEVFVVAVTVGAVILSVWEAIRWTGKPTL